MKPIILKKMLIICVLLLVIFQEARSQSIYAYGYTFSAFSSPFSYITGGTSIPAIQVDDNYTSIPIGFTFRFCGVDYTDVTVCSNGWLRFGVGAGTSVANWNYNDQVNSGVQPCVYALYEDISGSSGTSQYKVTGTSPNRVFTWECRNWLWDYAASTPCISFQVKLYETTNIIEVVYHQESGSVQVNTSGGATIGIAKSGTDWQVLNDASSSPVSSTSTYVYNISSRPATDQCYQWNPGPACLGPAPVSTTNIASRGASLVWTTVPGGGSYEYVLNTNPADPTVAGTITSLTNATFAGLLPSTLYYFHVRYKCSPVSFSPWVTYSFTTRPDCGKPGNLLVTAIDTNSATLQWNNITTATAYQYLINNQRQSPANGIGTTTLTTPFISLTGLTEGTWYYIHYRSLCAGNDSSAWQLDSFRTPIPCRRPVLGLSTLTADNSIVFWSPVKTAISYEYFLGSTSTEPVIGTPIKTYSVQTPYLQPKTQYYMFVRCNCEDNGVKSNSPWSMIDYVTPPPLDVENIVGSNELLIVYPNPTKNYLQVDVRGHYTNMAQIQIVDVTGKFVVTKKLTEKSLSLDVSSLSSGVYILQLVDDGIKITTRFTKD
ncbi:MAG: T9SS type A sorting domain-containing protein [Chitinophagales bacterium]|nr:T9SS type A sorting domain-containing protein [Chitinophagales bacterium]